MALTEEEPFSVSPHPTSDWFRDRSGCQLLNRPVGFAAPGNDDSACGLHHSIMLLAGIYTFIPSLVLISSAKTEFTVDLYPILSMTKISPCFSDILFPIEVRRLYLHYTRFLTLPQYYYDRSWWSGKFAYSNNIEWSKKKSQICTFTSFSIYFSGLIPLRRLERDFQWRVYLRQQLCRLYPV
jgi:hypothetical protein